MSIISPFEERVYTFFINNSLQLYFEVLQRENALQTFIKNPWFLIEAYFLPKKPNSLGKMRKR